MKVLGLISSSTDPASRFRIIQYKEALAKEKQEFEALKASVQSTENPVVKRRPGRPAKAN